MKSVCKVDGCDGVVNARSLCVRHYSAARHAGTLDEHDLDHFFPSIDFCRCPAPTPEPVKLWGHVVIPDAFQCADCGRGFDPAEAERSAA